MIENAYSIHQYNSITELVGCPRLPHCNRLLWQPEYYLNIVPGDGKARGWLDRPSEAERRRYYTVKKNQYMGDLMFFCAFIIQKIAEYAKTINMCHK